MAKKIKHTLAMMTMAEIDSKIRRAMRTDGTINGFTKIQGKKGKKAYNRQKSNNPKNW